MHLSQWHYLHLEKLSQVREKLWGKSADVDPLKKEKTEVIKNRQNKNRGEHRVQDRIQVNFIRTALAFHFHLNHLLGSRLKESVFDFLKISQAFMTPYPWLNLKLCNKYISLNVNSVIYSPFSPLHSIMHENCLNSFLCCLSNT